MQSGTILWWVQVWYYLLPLIGGSEAKLLLAREYSGPVEHLQLHSSHAAVLIRGQPLHVPGYPSAFDASLLPSYELFQ